MTPFSCLEERHECVQIAIPTDLAKKPTVDAAFSKVKDVGGAAMLAQRPVPDTFAKVESAAKPTGSPAPAQSNMPSIE